MDAAALKNQKELVYMSNKDESYRVIVAYLANAGQSSPTECKKDIEEYKWRDGDFLQASYPKCGTHLVWEIMCMLLKEKAEYINLPQVAALVGITPFEVIDQKFPSPRVLNTHYRLDVLPDEYQNRKTVCVIRNPKDTLVSYYNMIKRIIYPMSDRDANKFTLEDFVDEFLYQKVDTIVWGSYFKFVEYMWDLSKTHPNMLVVFFEDVVRNRAENIRKLNEFMGTGRDDEMIQEIVDATEFKKMKEGKLNSELQLWPKLSAGDSQLASCKDTLPEDVSVFRKGVIGDWKNWFTVAMNEKFDKYLEAWKPAQEIPFIYE